MDYTLIHYNVEEWEKRAYEYLKDHFLAEGWPVQDLEFDPAMVCRGLIIDADLGNLVKANRFGFIKKAIHGTSEMDFENQKKIYSRVIVDLSEPRWIFLNTLFSLSEGCFYSQLVELLDQHKLPGVMGYVDLYRHVRDGLSFAHMEGRLKEEIINDPEKYVDLDPKTPLALLDQKNAGKKLMLITNSEWSYTVPMMKYAFDRFLPEGMTWRDLFDVSIVSARKPDFFTSESPFFEVVTEEGLLSPHQGDFIPGKAYLGGSAKQLEKALNLSGDEILYVGDHMFGDVRVSKGVLRWRTALILRELEEEMSASQAFRKEEVELAGLMDQKEALEVEICQVRLSLQRKKLHYGDQNTLSEKDLEKNLLDLRKKIEQIDIQIAPIARSATALNNQTWGLLMRAGNDKSHLASQIERFADIYTSRVSNFLLATPFTYLRSPRGSLPHDPSLPEGKPHSAR
jgi:5'-nucleotidase